jgi:hypothetical protein
MASFFYPQIPAPSCSLCFAGLYTTVLFFVPAGQLCCPAIQRTVKKVVLVSSHCKYDKSVKQIKVGMYSYAGWVYSYAAVKYLFTKRQSEMNLCFKSCQVELVETGL